MGKKTQQIHYMRAMAVTPDDIISRLRDAATANIQMRILRKLVNLVDGLKPYDMDGSGGLEEILRDIECLRSDWDELVATLNCK